MKNIVCYVFGLQMLILVFGRSVRENMNPQEQVKYYQGDIILPQVNLRNAKRNGRWPNGVIPYEISGNFNYNEINVIHEAANTFQEYTCLRWVPRTTEDAWVRITNHPTGCFGNLGYTGSVQTLLLGPTCVSLAIVIHEMMHLAGFEHEHNRSDRDNYVTIDYQNIEPKMQNAFDKATENEFTHLGLAYDYYSIMHYAHNAFSINGQDTIIPTKKGVILTGANRFSETDIIRINTWYNCRK